MATERRLIDANALMERLKFKRRISEVGLYRGLESAMAQCAKAPTVDAVEVVRCKDCKHYVDSPYDNGDMMCDYWGEWIFPEDNDFCSGGERKDYE